jgi:hypothetical protein
MQICIQPPMSAGAQMALRGAKVASRQDDIRVERQSASDTNEWVCIVSRAAVHRNRASQLCILL